MKWINSRYEIRQRVAPGGSSEVFRAIDRGDAEEPLVVIKLLNPSPMDNADLHRQFFEREVRALSSLNHPSIVQLLDRGVDEQTGRYYIVLENIDHAVTLRQRFPDSWQPDLNDCIDFVCLLLDAAHYAHQLDVIHRDLNPSNILMSFGNPKIIDFGVCKILSDLTSGTTVSDFFTREYASPEQLARQPVTGSTDVYSLAGVLFFMLTRGREPETDVPLTDQFDSLPNLPESFRICVRRMAAQNVSDRYRTAAQARLELVAVREGLIKDTRSYALAITSNVVQRLYDNVLIDSAEIPKALDRVRAYLSGDVYLSFPKEDDPTTPSIELVGGGVVIRCATRDRLTGKPRLIATSLRHNVPAHVVERLRSEGYQVHGAWRVGSLVDKPPVDVDDIDDLVDEARTTINDAEIEKQIRARRKELVFTWNYILEEFRTQMLEQRRSASYTSWTHNEATGVIRIKLSSSFVGSPPFVDDELLVMTPANTRGSHKQERSVRVGYYLRNEGSEILVSRLPNVDLSKIRSSGEVWGDERQWLANYSRQRNALNNVVDNSCINPRLPDVLNDPSQARRFTRDPILQFFRKNLDPSKREAVEAALSCRDLYLIQGPPGTGKTFVISEIIAQILGNQPTSNILLVSQSHVAVDNALKDAADLIPGLQAVRLGRELKSISADVSQFRLDSVLTDWAGTIARRCESRRPLRIDPLLDVATRGALADLATEWLAAEADGAKPDLGEVRGMLADYIPSMTIRTPEDIERLVVSLNRGLTPQEEQIDAVITDWLKRVGKIEDLSAAFLQNCRLVTGTCVGVAGERALPDYFDWAIIDEAGHATAPEILIPMVKASRSILVGDHKQLPPTIEESIKKRVKDSEMCDDTWLDKSLFEHLFERLDNELKTTLTSQYRMHPAIARLVSSVFYPSENLTSGVTAEERQHGWARWQYPVIWYSTSGRADRGEQRVGSSMSICNPAEASIIEGELVRLEEDLRQRGASKKIGIISGYSEQVDFLRRRIDPLDTSRWSACLIEINTVDAFQGRDRDIVFYSVARSNAECRIGFLEDCRRLNVALSRGRELLFIVGDDAMLQRANVRQHNPFQDILLYLASNISECLLYTEGPK